MAKTSKDIANDLLKSANYYWYDDNSDNVRPINPDDFDPIVDKIFKANAVELEKIYAELRESHQEVILGLSRTLVPDQLLLPEPGYTIAQIKPKVTRLETTPEDTFLIGGQSDTGEQFEFYFSPLYEHDQPKCDLVAVMTDHLAVQFSNNQPEIVHEIPDGKATSSIWIALDMQNVKEHHSVSFFLGNRIVDEFEKDYHIFHNSRWLLNGDPDQVLKMQSGIDAFTEELSAEDLLEKLAIPNSYEQQIASRFKNSFLVLKVPFDLDRHKRTFPPEVNDELKNALSVKDPVCWIKIDLHIPIADRFLVDHILYPNCIPLVNRRLRDNFVIKSNYDRILLPMPTEDHFLDVYKVQDTKNLADGTAYQQIDFLHPDSQAGTFMLRSGARVRRLNREDATRRISRLLEIIQDEYSTFKEEGVNRLKEDFDVIEKAINRIKRQLPDYFRQEESKASYFGVANFRAGVSRISYSYWETQGESIKVLGDKIALAVSSSDVQISNSTTVIPIQRGKGERNSEEYINHVRLALLSHGKISTRGDIERFCDTRYGHLLRVSAISRKLMVVDEGQLGRGIVVTVQLVRPLSKREADYVRIELQNDLNAKSTLFTPIKVELAHDRPQ